MKKIRPSWINWSITDTIKRKTPDRVKPPSVNKKQGQGGEVADLKSATKPFSDCVIRVNAEYSTEESSNVDINDIKNNSNDIKDNQNNFRLNRILKKLKRKSNVENILLGNVNSSLDKSDVSLIPHSANKPISAKPTKAYKKFTKEQLSDNRTNVKDYRSPTGYNWKLNPKPVKSEFSFDNLRSRKLGSTLSLLFGKIAEERMGDKTIGSDKWDIEQVMFRRISKKLITNCKYSREKQKVIIMLDSSPSCSRMANLYSQISTESCRYEDVELYDAPNGYAHSKYSIYERKFIPLSNEEIDLTFLWSGFEGRTIIYFGDTDALRSINSAYKHNEIHWFFQGRRRGNSKSLKIQTDTIRKQYGDKVNVYSANTIDEIVRAVRDIR